MLLGVTLLAGQAWSARLRRDAMEFRGGKVGGPSPVNLVNAVNLC